MPEQAVGWWGRMWNASKSNEYTKREALRAGSSLDDDPVVAYNDSRQGKDNPITQEDIDNWDQYGDTKAPAGTEGTAIGQSKYEIELSKSREAERKVAQKRAEELLANQPDYTIPESVQGYVNMMTDIGNLLGGITDASGGGSPSYTIQPYTVKNSPGYDVDQKKNSAGGLDAFAQMAGDVRNQVSIPKSGYNKTTIPTEGYSSGGEALYSQWRLDKENQNRKKGNSASQMSTY
jgi:hypothetical protein